MNHYLGLKEAGHCSPWTGLFFFTRHGTGSPIMGSLLPRIAGGGTTCAKRIHCGAPMRKVAVGLIWSVAAQMAYSQSASVTGAHVGVTDQVIWSPQPVGPQPLPNMPPIDLLESVGEYPLTPNAKQSCLLVARRGGTVVAVELAPLTIGPRVIGWSPKVIDEATLTSKWHYRQPKWIEQGSVANPVTAAIASASPITASNIVTNMAQTQTTTSSTAKTWSRPAKDAQGHEVARTEAAETVTVNGKTYSKYTNFRAASTDAPTGALDEYFCER